jgi:hypothetical protein
MPRALMFCIGGLCCAAIAVQAQNPQTVFLPPVNLAASETAEVQITSSAAAYVGEDFVANCYAVVTFYGAHGSMLGTYFNFAIGDTRQIFSAELPYAMTGGSGSNASISAQIALTAAPAVVDLLAPPIPLCALVYSLNTHDSASGVTHTFVTGRTAFGATFLTGIPEIRANIVLSPVGLGSSETVQVNLANTAQATSSGDAPSCTGSASFYDVTGTIIGAPTSFTVGTGEISSATIPYASTGATGGGRTMIRAEIALNAACLLGYSFGTYDTTTGVTHAWASGTTAQPTPLGFRSTR